MSEPFLGEIIMFAGNFAPRGWALCNGQLLSIAQNTALFSILGTTYGGNGQTTFALPDLRGRVPISSGQGPGLSAYTLGEMSGSETVTLISSQMPAHTHMVNCDNNTIDSPTPANSIPGSNGFGGTNLYSTQAPNNTMNPQMIGVAGGSQPHNNMQPFLVVNFIIALQGLFPSRN